MSKTFHLENILSRQEKARLNLDLINADELKRIARFWFGTTLANKMRKAECLNAINSVFKDRARVEKGVHSLSDQERQILSVFKRYGGALSGPLLMCETLLRGLFDKTVERGTYYNRAQSKDPVEQLCEKLILITTDGRAYSDRGHYHYGYRRSVPDLVLQPIVSDLIEPAKPMAWTPSASASAPMTTNRRSAAQIALDLWGIAQALAQSGSWKTNRGGSLAKSVQNRLKKVLPGGEFDPMMPPAVESLYYEILRGIGAVKADDDGGIIDVAPVESSLRRPAVVQSWHWARAWIHARLWQDGFGVLPERKNCAEWIEPKVVLHAREVLVWALCRVAHGNNDWLDLETFIEDLCSATGEDTINFCCMQEYTWWPKFVSAKAKADTIDDKARRRAYWLNKEGIWASNAIMGTFFYLGLIERGCCGSAAKERYSFRLTDMGRAVFRCPESPQVELPHDAHFLAVQPNHEVIAYLDTADASAVWPLAQLGQRISATSGFVQSFALTRESIYQALESGLELDQIRGFLTDHSKTGLPANVAHSLDEWGKRREALVLRANVSLGITSSKTNGSFKSFPDARWIGDNFVLLPAAAERDQGRTPVVNAVNHNDLPRRTWAVDEEGTVTVTAEADSVSLARLDQFSDYGDKVWQITAASVRRARDRGIPAEQILGWLGAHLINELPALLETAIRNWSSPASVFFGNLLMLQIPQPQACAAILASQRLRHFLLDHVPPNWFVALAEHRVELEQALTKLGFLINQSYPLKKMSESREKADQDSAVAGAGRRPKKLDK